MVEKPVRAAHRILSVSRTVAAAPAILARGVRSAPAPRRFDRAVASHVLPRLLLAHRNPAPGACAGALPCAEDVAALAELVLADDLAGAASFVDTLRRRGVPAERLCLDLLAPAARRLGEMWCEDHCHFADVTLGVMRLGQVLREIAPDAREIALGAGRRVLLCPLPGEQHGFGIAMVARFFARAGWDVVATPFGHVRDLVARVRRESFAIVGLSVGRREALDPLAAAIQAVRRASCNPAVGILVGGNAFAGRPELAALVGADATAADGLDAVRQAERLRAVLAHEA